jgi:hypothetical protein
MNAKDAIRSSMGMGLFVVEKYLSDLDDADLMRRPAAGCNHLAWQLGHLISSESGLVSMVCPGQGAELPEGFREAHAKENIGNDDASQFRTKQEYIDLYRAVRAKTLEALDTLPEERLAEPGPEAFRNVFPRVLDVWNLIGTHPLMHAGQFVVVRRQLGKPILI